MSFAQGKKVLITGSTDGIGKATALALAHAGATVIVHGRNPARAENAAQEIRAAVPGADVDFVAADFTSLEEVQALAGTIKSRHAGLRILINNAGVYSPRCQQSADGIELTLAVNHLAPFLLTTLVVDLLKAHAPARIITVASMLHEGASLRLERQCDDRSYDGHRAYATSKLANVLFSVELAQRLAGTGVTSNCLHPGGVNTKLLRAGFGAGGVPADEGARTSVYLGTAEELQDVTGRYFSRERETAPDPRAHDRELRNRFWQLSERLVGLA